MQDVAAQELAKQVVEFLAQRGGRAGSSQVVEQFTSNVRPTEAALFRQVLQSVAKLQRGGGGKEWVLRPDFADIAPVALSGGPS